MEQVRAVVGPLKSETAVNVPGTKRKVRLLVLSGECALTFVMLMSEVAKFPSAEGTGGGLRE